MPRYPPPVGKNGVIKIRMETGRYSKFVARKS